MAKGDGEIVMGILAPARHVPRARCGRSGPVRSVWTPDRPGACVLSPAGRGAAWGAGCDTEHTRATDSQAGQGQKDGLKRGIREMGHGEMAASAGANIGGPRRL